MKYRVSMHTYGYYKPDLTCAELDTIFDHNCDISLIYQITEDYYREANFGDLEDIKEMDIGNMAFLKEAEEVSVRVEGYFCFYVEAEDAQEAERKGDEKWTEADFGELEDVEYDTCIIRRSF